MPDPIDAFLSQYGESGAAGAGDTDTILSLIGREIIGGRGERFKVQLAPGVKTNQVGNLLNYVPLSQILSLRSGTRVVPFRQGQYIDALSASIFGVDEAGAVAPGRTLTADEREGFGLSLAPSGTGSSGSAPAYSSTRQAAQEARAFEKQQAEANRQFQREQDRINAEARLRESRLSVLTNLVDRFISEQGRGVEVLASLQPDPFRFAAAAQGMPVLGTTPQAGFQQALQGFLARPTPPVNPNASLTDINAAITGLTGQNMPLNPGVFGMAEGGMVPMGETGTYVVGEQGPEVMEVTPYGVTVKPLQGGFAQGGGVKFDAATLRAGLGPIFEGLFGPGGGIPGHAQTARRLQTLGIAPNLVSTAGRLFFRDMSGGYLEASPGFLAQFGYDPERAQVLNSMAELRALAGPAGVTLGTSAEQGRAAINPTLRPRPIGPATTLGEAFVEPVTGAVMPAPWKVAAKLKQLKATDPFLYDLAVSGFESAGIPRQALDTAINTFTPQGVQRQTVGYAA